MLSAPCKDCERMPCGAYHDQCEDYQKFIKENKTLKMTARNMKDTCRAKGYLKKLHHRNEHLHIKIIENNIRFKISS